MADTNGKHAELPQPKVEFFYSGTPSTAMTPAGVMGILMNPLNAGAGSFPGW